jgi:diphosphomevalonate decarboxylase
MTQHNLHELFRREGYDLNAPPDHEIASGYAPVNWALVKYWGKRDDELNLPAVSSLSIAAPLFTQTQIECADKDQLKLDGIDYGLEHDMARRLFAFADTVLGSERPGLAVRTFNNVPTATGFASSAAGFAAFVSALNNLYGWEMDDHCLSILARIGSGSACRSLFPGFVKWHKGTREDGMDSHAEALSYGWPELRIGMLSVSEEKKPLGSTQAMKHCAATSPMYPDWLAANERAMQDIEAAVAYKDMMTFVKAAEANALLMHETIRASAPLDDGARLDYFLDETWENLHKAQNLRETHGYAIGATMDAGPQVKLLFGREDEEIVREIFPDSQILEPWFG